MLIDIKDLDENGYLQNRIKQNWLKNNDGTPIGVSNKDPILNTIRILKSLILLN